ncbi:hypothetical protein CEP51_003352 [Fusarium floridanum]|uniref:Zonadhesin n=1 Tax=Fusarium floridanum TaxID=1325733 RepID=A0A428S6L0_9HYPO|nr:hypothetical protein CEP51_003352 [Fusarium floridanum]
MHQPPYPENTWSQPSPREYEPVAQNEQRDLPSPLETPLDHDNLHQPHPVQHSWSPTAPREYKAVPQNAWPIEEDRSDSPPPFIKSEGPSSELPKSDYRPIALRWHFIGLIILAIGAISGSMGYALHNLKDSDSTYKLETRSLQGSLGLIKRTVLRFETRDIEVLKRELGIVERQAAESEAAVVSVDAEPTQAANEPSEPSEEPADAVTEVEVKPAEPTEDVPTEEAPTEEAPTEDKTEPSPTEDDNKSSPSPTEDDSNDTSPSPTEKNKSSPSPTEDDESVSSPTPTDDDIISSTPTDNKAKNKPSTTVTDNDKDKTSATETDDDDDSKTSPTATETDDDDEPRRVTALVEKKYTSTIVSSSAMTAYSTNAVVTRVETIESTMVFTVAGYTSTYAIQPEADEPQGLVPEYTTEIQPAKETTQITLLKSSYVETLATTQTSYGPPVTYVETGTTRLTSVFYVDDDGKPIEKAVTQVKTSERPATVMTITETPPVETIRQTQADGQVITILSTPLPTTRVTSLGPTRVVVTDVSTPTGDFKIVMEVTTYTLTSAGYFIGKFLPPIIAVLLAMTLRAIHQAATQFQPFAALSRPEGALGKDALTLRFDGLDSVILPFKLLANSQPLPFITALAAWGSSLFAPLASEAIGLKIHGRCRKGSFGGCALELGISESSAYGLLALLIAIGALLIATIIVISRRWKTGVAANPWCSANAAALMARNPDLRALPLHDYRALKDAVVDKRFKMGTFRNYEGRDEYGVVLHHGHNHGAEAYGTTPFDEGGPRAQSHRAPQTFAALTFWYRFFFGLFLLCLLAFICYYHFIDTFGKLPKGLKDAMESSQFGVRFVCSAIGVAVIWLWDMLFTSVAAITPFRRMADKSQSPTRSVLMTPPTNAFSGLFVALRVGDLLLFLTAVASLMAQFLPILFANVPYSLTQTLLAHQVCSRLSAGLLVFMVIGLFGSLFVKWPDLPVDPRSLVGAMYYVAEAPWVAGVEGVAGMNAKDRKRKIQGLGGRWSYGYVQTGHGRRLAIEHDMGYR